MAIQLHSLVSIGKRYIQVESQPHHITGILRKIIYSCKKMYKSQLLERVDSAYFECKEDGTITCYQAGSTDAVNSGIWTYLVYECSEDEEKIFRDSSIDTSTKSLQELLAGRRLVQVGIDIYEYLKYQFYESEYLDVHLPINWDNPVGREIAILLLEEYKAFKSSFLFAGDVGQQYVKTVINEFIQAGWEILENGGTCQQFEVAQYEVLKKIRIHEIANLILEYNDYRLWQAALPSKSKAVEYAFNAALDLICRIK